MMVARAADFWINHAWTDEPEEYKNQAGHETCLSARSAARPAHAAQGGEL